MTAPDYFDSLIHQAAEFSGRQTEARFREVTHDLVERIKELNCLYGISRLVEKENISLNDILQGVVDLIPAAWQYPEVTCGRIGLKNRQFTSPNFRKTAWKQVESIIVSGKNVGSLEVYYLQPMPNSYEGPFLKEERYLIHGIAERLGHIIESKNAEDTLKKLYAREKKLHQKLQLEMENRVHFTRQLVHELKTPLTSLMATSQLLNEETRKTRLEKLAGFVSEGAIRLNSRIDELHDVIKGEIGKLKLEIKPLNIEQLLRSVVEETAALSQQYGVSVSFERVDDNLPVVSADSERVRQILFNLINNACEYASKGKKIIIRAGLDPDSRKVLIEVKDYGPGISRNKKTVLFKPGYQISQPDEGSGGLGIGLTLCKMLVALHSGDIWVESKLGEGSSFFFTLPVAEPVKPD
jgi:signal transduction histidine kinase